MCCTVWSREAGGSRESSTGGKSLPWDQPILDVMHNHVPSQLGFVSIVPGVARGGDEGEDEYS